MSMSDPLADMLTRIRNASERQHPAVSIPHSKIKEAVAGVMKEQGYIEDYQVLPERPQAVLRIRLKYAGDRRNRRAIITGLKRISKPGRRQYVGKTDIPWVLNGMGITIVTTSMGVMTGQEARRRGIGGEVLCNIW